MDCTVSRVLRVSKEDKEFREKGEHRDQWAYKDFRDR
jgi:hypothetical protein